MSARCELFSKMRCDFEVQVITFHQCVEYVWQVNTSERSCPSGKQELGSVLHSGSAQFDEKRDFGELVAVALETRLGVSQGEARYPMMQLRQAVVKGRNLREMAKK